MHDGPRAMLAARRVMVESTTQYCAMSSIQVLGSIVYRAIDVVAFFTEQELYW